MCIRDSYKSVFQVSAFEVSVFGEMAIRGLGIPEKGFREFEFTKLTGYRLRLLQNKLWLLPNLVFVTIYLSVSRDIHDCWLELSRRITAILSQISVDTLSWVLLVKTSRHIFQWISSPGYSFFTTTQRLGYLVLHPRLLCPVAPRQHPHHRQCWCYHQRPRCWVLGGRIEGLWVLSGEVHLLCRGTILVYM